jgi:hypothetical protein
MSTPNDLQKHSTQIEDQIDRDFADSLAEFLTISTGRSSPREPHFTVPHLMKDGKSISLEQIPSHDPYDLSLINSLLHQILNQPLPSNLPPPILISKSYFYQYCTSPGCAHLPPHTPGYDCLS